MQASGQLHLEVTYKPFEDDDTDSGYREAEAYALLLQQQAITDVKVGPYMLPLSLAIALNPLDKQRQAARLDYGSLCWGRLLAAGGSFFFKCLLPYKLHTGTNHLWLV